MSESNVCDQQMVLEASWGSRGAVLELRGIVWEVSRASKLTQEGFRMHPGIILGLGRSLLAVDDGLGSVDVVLYILSESLGIDPEVPN